MKRLAFLLTLTGGFGFTDAVASDFNPLGFYIGAAVGRSYVRTSVATDPIYEFDKRDTGWKVLVGLRPIHLIAAELSWVDFGHPRSSPNLGIFTWNTDVLQRAQTLSALVFAPIPLPLVDLYARAGLARLQTSGNAFAACTPGYPCPLIVPLPSLQLDHTNTDFLYGAGVQVKFSALAVRLECERINDGHGDPDLLSAGLTWTF